MQPTFGVKDATFLVGKSLRFRFTSGREHVLDFEPRAVTINGQGDTPCTTEYRTYRIRPDLYFLTWRNGGDAVAAVIDFMQGKLILSPQAGELGFDEAELRSMNAL